MSRKTLTKEHIDIHYCSPAGHWVQSSFIADIQSYHQGLADLQVNREFIVRCHAVPQSR